MATVTTAATIPSPPMPSTRMWAMLMSDGDGAVRCHGTTTDGRLGRLRYEKSDEQSEDETAEQPRDQHEE